MVRYLGLDRGCRGIPLAVAVDPHNELVGLLTRVLMIVPQVDESAWADVFRCGLAAFDRLLGVSIRPSGRMSFEKWSSGRIRAGDREEAEQLYKELPCTGISKDIAKVTAFVKSDEILPKLFASMDFDPRVIAGPSLEMKVALGPYLIRMSKYLSRYLNVKSQLCYASGETSEGLGGWMDENYRLFGKFFCIEVDYKRWDAHVGASACFCEREFIRKLFGPPKFVMDALYAQLQTRGRMMKSGIRYHHKYGRRSGDPNTSVGNSLLNLALNYTILRELFEDDEFRIIVLGDDMLAAVRLDCLHKWDRPRYEEFTALHGLVPEIQVHEDGSMGSFCSSYFYPLTIVRDGMTKETHVLAPKASRSLAKWGWTREPVANARRDDTLLGSAVMSMLPHGYAVPGLRALLRMHQGLTRYDKRKLSWNVDPRAHEYLLTHDVGYYFDFRYIGFIHRRYGCGVDVYDNFVCQGQRLHATMLAEVMETA